MIDITHDKILVLGATGFVGKTVCRLLKKKGSQPIQSSKSLGIDLRDPKQAEKLFAQIRPDGVINCAAYVGGIQFGYDHPAEIFRNNLLMIVNIYEACKKYNVKRLVNPISNCAYPEKATLFKEDEFWDGPLHESVMVYGMARKMSWIGSWAYHKQYGIDSINLILSNMYGPGDHFDPVRSHALGALIVKMAEAKAREEQQVIIWGTGKPVREWLYIEDAAKALIRALSIDSYIDPINVGVAGGVSIIELAKMIKNAIKYEGNLVLDPSKPDGAPYKTVDGSLGERILRWKPQKKLDDGIRETIQWYLETRHSYGNNSS